MKKKTLYMICILISIFFIGIIILKPHHTTARAYHSVAQSIANQALLDSAYNSERWDDSNIHDTVTNNSRMTAPTNGYYIIVSVGQFDLNGTGNRQQGIRFNGTTRHPGNVEKLAASNTNTGIPVITIYKMNSSEYFESRWYQNSGGALNLVSLAQRSPEIVLHGIAPF